MDEQQQNPVRALIMSEWRDYQMLVLSQLNDLRQDNREMKQAITSLAAAQSLVNTENKIQIDRINSKATFWGSIGGTFGSIGTIATYLFYMWATKTKS